MGRGGQFVMRALGAVLGLAAAATAAAGGVRVVVPPTPDAVILKLDPRGSPLPAPVAGGANDRELLAQADRLQYLHRFEAAELLLDRWLAQHPDDNAVMLRRAQLRLALGRPQAALADCLRAAAGLPALAASGCEAQVLAALGDVARARRSIESALAASGVVRGTLPSVANVAVPRESFAQWSWAAGIAAELAGRTGDRIAAERWYELALATAGDNHFPRVAYAEFLLAQRQPERALTLLETAPDNVAVMSLRRRALAERRP